jgi:hypothetical protein
MRFHHRPVLLAISALLIASASAITAHAQDVRFGFLPAVQGMRSTISGDMKMTITLHVEADGEAQDVTIGNSRSASWRETVLTVSDSDAAVSSIVFDAFEEKNENPMEQEESSIAPAIAREYVVDRRDTVTVTVRDGKPIPSSEKAYLRDMALRTPFDEGFSAFLRDRTFRKGVKTVIDKALASTIFEAINDDKGVRELSVTLREMRTVQNVECGVFDIVFKVSTEMGPIAVDMDIIGEAVMRVPDSRAVSFQFKGPMQLAASETEFSASGSGEFRMSKTFLYSAE